MKFLKDFLASPTWEAVKEVARLALFGAISLFVSMLLDKLVSLPQDSVVIVLTLVLRAADKYLHESGVADKGLSRF